MFSSGKMSFAGLLTAAVLMCLACSTAQAHQITASAFTEETLKGFSVQCGNDLGKML